MRNKTLGKDEKYGEGKWQRAVGRCHLKKTKQFEKVAKNMKRKA